MAFELPEALTLAWQMDTAKPGLAIQRVSLSPACENLIRQGSTCYVCPRYQK